MESHARAQLVLYKTPTVAVAVHKYVLVASMAQCCVGNVLHEALFRHSNGPCMQMFPPVRHCCAKKLRAHVLHPRCTPYVHYVHQQRTLITKSVRVVHGTQHL